MESYIIFCEFHFACETFLSEFLAVVYVGASVGQKYEMNKRAFYIFNTFIWRNRYYYYYLRNGVYFVWACSKGKWRCVRESMRKTRADSIILCSNQASRLRSYQLQLFCIHVFKYTFVRASTGWNRIARIIQFKCLYRGIFRPITSDNWC